jgi:cold shock CspA family protein
MKGSITQILKKQQCGFILSEEGNEVYFNDDGVEGAVSDFRVGSWVEFEIQYGLERPHAVNVKKVLARDKRRPVGASRA